LLGPHAWQGEGIHGTPGEEEKENEICLLHVSRVVFQKLPSAQNVVPDLAGGVFIDNQIWKAPEALKDCCTCVKTVELDFVWGGGGGRTTAVENAFEDDV